MKKSLLLLTAALLVHSLAAAETATRPDAPAPQPPPSPVKRQEGPQMRRELASAVWRAFASLPEKERAELLKLQRDDWDSYRKKILALGEKLLAEEKARRAVLAEDLRRYQDPATGEEEKAKIRIRLQEALRAEYLERLQENRRRIEEMKKRTAKMEKELDRRSAAMEKAVEARLNYMLKTGNPDLPPPPQRKSWHGGPRRGPGPGPGRGPGDVMRPAAPPPEPQPNAEKELSR